MAQRASSNVTEDFSSGRRGEKGYLMSNGYGPLKDKTFRIAHMGDLTEEELKAYLKDLEETIAELKAKA